MRAADKASAEPEAPHHHHTKAAPRECGEQGGQTKCGASVRVWHSTWHGSWSSSSWREGRVSFPTQETSSPTSYLLDSKPSHGLDQAASAHQSACQKYCGKPDWVPAQRCGCLGLWLLGVAEPVATNGGWQRYCLHEVQAGGRSDQPGGRAQGGGREIKLSERLDCQGEWAGVRPMESLPAMPEGKAPGRHIPNSCGPPALLL